MSDDSKFHVIYPKDESALLEKIKPTKTHRQARQSKALTEAVENAVGEGLQVARPPVRHEVRLPRAHGGVRAPPRPPGLRVRGPLHELSTRQHLCLHLYSLAGGTWGDGGENTYFKYVV